MGLSIPSNRRGLLRCKDCCVGWHRNRNHFYFFFFSMIFLSDVILWVVSSPASPIHFTPEMSSKANLGSRNLGSI
jgi:hypothetical protein